MAVVRSKSTLFATSGTKTDDFTTLDLPFLSPPPKAVIAKASAAAKSYQESNNTESKHCNNDFAKYLLEAALLYLEYNVVSTAVASSWNTFASTKDTFESTRFSAVAYTDFTLFAAMQIASLFQRRYKDKASEYLLCALKEIGDFANPFSFVYGIGCKLIAYIDSKNLPEDKTSDIIMGSIIGVSLAFALIKCIPTWLQKCAPKCAPKKSSSLTSVTKKLFLSVGLTMLVSRSERIVEYFPGVSYNSLMEDISNLAPLAIALTSSLGLCLAGKYLAPKNIDSTTHTITRAANFLYTIGTELSAFKPTKMHPPLATDEKLLVSMLQVSKVILAGTAPLVVRICCPNTLFATLSSLSDNNHENILDAEDQQRITDQRSHP